MRKIFFSRSVTGETPRTDAIQRIAFELFKFGDLQNAGDVESKVLSPRSRENPENPDPARIFQHRRTELEESDILVAEVSSRSHGVGRELCFAEISVGIPILALHAHDAPVSPTISGNPAITLKTYHSLDEIPDLIAEFFENLDNPKKEKTPKKS